MVLEQNKNKRPFCDGEPCQLTSKKHAGQLEYNSQLSTLEEIIPCSNLCNELFDAGAKWPSRCAGNETLPIHNIDESKVLAGGEFQNVGVCDIFSVSWPDASGGSCQAWANVLPKDEFVVSDLPEEESESCGLQDYRSGHVLAQNKEPKFALIDYYYRKPVAIGPDYQAYVPSWELEHLHPSLSSKRAVLTMSANPANSSSVERNRFMVEEDDQRRMGSCIIQMPDMESDSYSDKSIGCGRVNCTCLDEGLVRCVRQHIAEEREKLKLLLGPNILMELGFDEMGEDVADSWSMEEENLFQEVVYSNPVSMGKNFWTELPLAFPTRSKKELVSYYFNVFMLGKRALQNRWEACDADSDNDEWQGGDSNELAASEEDEDSIMGSEAVERDGHTVCHVCENEEEHDYDEEEEVEDEDEELELEENEKWEEDARFEDVSEEHDAQNCSTDSDAGCISGLHQSNYGRCTDDQDVQDESSMSYECYQIGKDFHTVDTSAIPCPESTRKSQGDIVDFHSMNDEYCNRESGGVFGNAFLSEQPCDSKIWDVGFLSVSRKDVDILPTCSMMKEVFGEEAWNNEVLRDTSRIS